MVKSLTAEKDLDYDVIWENLSRRFGHINEPECANHWFGTKCQLENPKQLRSLSRGL